VSLVFDKTEFSLTPQCSALESSNIFLFFPVTLQANNFSQSLLQDKVLVTKIYDLVFMFYLLEKIDWLCTLEELLGFLLLIKFSKNFPFRISE